MSQQIDLSEFTQEEMLELMGGNAQAVRQFQFRVLVATERDRRSTRRKGKVWVHPPLTRNMIFH